MDSLRRVAHLNSAALALRQTGAPVRLQRHHPHHPETDTIGLQADIHRRLATILRIGLMDNSLILIVLIFLSTAISLKSPIA
jgi:ABC-type nickel/cobalt efflux system permease component RcnA